MDPATVIGLIGGTVLLLGSILLMSPLTPFLNGASAIMVLGGSICAALISFPMSNVSGVLRVLRRCLFSKADDPRELIFRLVGLAEIARRDGVLALEKETEAMDDQFLQSGMRLAIDGTDGELIETILAGELECIEARHAAGRAVFENIGKYAPAFGMIGTLIGLVVMLRNMADPKNIGPAMGIALLTTLYGAVIANLFALPLAEKLAARSREEILSRTIMIRGILAIQRGENPRLVEQRLRTFLPKGRRGAIDHRVAA